MKTFLLLFLFLSIQAIRLQAQNVQKKCACCSEKFREFDFWIGEWEVSLANGNPAGTNRIVVLQDSCILQENWISAAAGYSGTSYNHYDPTSGKWRQLWIDNQAGNLLLEGSWDGEKMVMESAPLANQKGVNTVQRISWTPNSDGSVRQLWQSRAENSEEWTSVFDGLYRRKKD